MIEIKLKSWKPVVIFNCIVAPIILFCFLMILSGRVTVILKGYAVDSSDNLYIGKEHSIEVYKEQKLINNIPIQYRKSFFRQTITRIFLICKATKPEKRKTHKHMAQYAESIISSRKKAMYIQNRIC